MAGLPDLARTPPLKILLYEFEKVSNSGERLKFHHKLGVSRSISCFNKIVVLVIDLFWLHFSMLPSSDDIIYSQFPSFTMCVCTWMCKLGTSIPNTRLQRFSTSVIHPNRTRRRRGRRLFYKLISMLQHLSFGLWKKLFIVILW